MLPLRWLRRRRKGGPDFVAYLDDLVVTRLTENWEDFLRDDADRWAIAEERRLRRAAYRRAVEAGMRP